MADHTMIDWHVAEGTGPGSVGHRPPATTVTAPAASTDTIPPIDPNQPLYPPDVSVPGPSEMSVINARPLEQTGTNDDLWRKKTFLDLADPIHKPRQDGMITFNIDAYNGPKVKPNSKNIMLSETLWLDGDLWQIKLLPKGTDAQPYPKIFVENVTLAHYERAEWTDQELIFPRFGGHKLNKSSQVAAQFSIVVYNPAEPRVYLFKNDMFQFTSSNQDRGWDSFVEVPWYNLHLRQHYQLKPLLQDDKLVIKAFIRTIDDPTRSLWATPAMMLPDAAGSLSIERSIDATGVLPLPLCGSTGAVINLLLHHKSLRCLLYTMSDSLNRLTSQHPSQALLLDLLQLLYNMRARKLHRTDRILFSIRCRLHELTFPYLRTTTGVDGDAIDAVETLKALSDYLVTCIGFHSSTMFQAGPSSLKTLLNRFVKDVAHLKPIRLHVHGKSDIQTLVMTHLDGEQTPWKFFELERQVFDPADRCWTKPCDQITMNPVIRHANGTYILHSFITHKGHLNSGQYKSYIRSTTPIEMWYTSNGTGGSFLSPKKAKAFEGSGTRFVSPRPRTTTNGRDFRGSPEEVVYVVCYRHADSDEYGLRHVTADEREWVLPAWLTLSTEQSVQLEQSGPNPQWTRPSEPYAIKLSGTMDVSREIDHGNAEGEDEEYVDSDTGGSSDSVEQSTDAISDHTIMTTHNVKSDTTTSDVSTSRQVKIEYIGRPFYEGTMQGTQYHGKGHCISMEGDEYIGTFEKGQYAVQGKLITHGGDIYVGHFKQGLFHGSGEIYYNNGDRYSGEFDLGLYEGQGMYVEKSTSNIYDGNWSKGKRHGSGVTYWKVSEEEKRLCKICLDQPADQVFLDCGHICCCESCASACEEECPVCRQEISGVHKVYLP